MIEQIYIPYWKWEDWYNGMWRKLTKENEQIYLKKAIEFTGDHLKYGKAMNVVINKWNNTMVNSLTNPGINKRAFLGHCACCYETKCPEYITRMAWKHLTEKQRYLADKVAQQTIDKWLVNYAEKNRTVHKNMGKQMLFEWNT